MSGKIFERNYYVHIYETNLRNELDIPYLMRYFEEMALMQSHAEGVGLDYYQKHDVAWVLHQFDIQIQRLPRFSEVVTLRTQPVSTYKFMGFRKYWVLDSNNKPLITADTSWLFINPKTRRPMRVNEDMKQAYGHAGAEEFKPDMADVPCLERVDLSKSFPVRFSDIDVNNHVNNTHYVEWALEALPPEVRDQGILRNIRIAFKKETAYGEMILSEAQQQQTTDGYQFLHRISTSDGTTRCLLSSHWENR